MNNNAPQVMTLIYSPAVVSKPEVAASQACQSEPAFRRLLNLPRVLFASTTLLIGIATVGTSAYAGPLASNDPTVATYGQSGAGLTPVTAADGGSCTVTGGGSRTGAMAFTSNGKLLICESGRWRRYAVWNDQAVSSGGACANTTGVGSFARGTDGKLYVCR